MNRLSSVLITMGITIIAAAGWLDLSYVVGKQAILNPELPILLGFTALLIIGGLFVSHLPQALWGLLVDPDPLEEPECTDEIGYTEEKE